MLQTLREAASRIWKTTFETTRRAPVEVLLSLLMASAVSADALRIVSDSERFVLPAILAWLLTFSISSLHALGVVDSTKRWALTGAYLAATAVYGVYFFEPELEASAWRCGLFLAASFFAVTLVPLLAKLGDASPSERFWRFNTRLLFRGAVAAVFSIGILAGIVSVLSMIQILFDTRIDKSVYQVAISFTLVGLSGTLLSGGLADIVRIDEAYSEDALRLLGGLGTFIFVPTTLAYLAIVYLYLGYIVFTGDSPNNVLSPLMLNAGLLGYAGLFVLWPFIERRESALMNFALKWFPAALLPTLPVAIWAILERIGQYGWTEFRYVRLVSVLCLGLFSLVAVVRVIQKQSFSLTSAPLILGAAALFAAVGPWSAPEVSERSQTARFVEMATEAGLMKNGTLQQIKKPDITSEERNSLRSTLTYLVSTHGAESIQPFTTKNLTGASHQTDVVKTLELQELFDGPLDKMRRLYRAAHESTVDVRATGTMHRLRISDREQLDGWKLELKGENLVARRGDHIHSISLAPLVELVAHEKSHSIGLSGEALSFVIGTQSAPVGQLFISGIDFTRDGDRWAILSLDGEILLPK